MTETMRKLSIYMIGLTFLSCLFSCTMIEELDDNLGVPPCEEKIAMTFSAVCQLEPWAREVSLEKTGGKYFGFLQILSELSLQVRLIR